MSIEQKQKEERIIALRNEQYPGRVLRMFNKTYIQGNHTTKTKQNKTKQNKTKQNKTKQNKTNKKS